MIRMNDIFTTDMEWDGEEAWLICAYTNILFRFNSENKTYTFVAALPQNGRDYYDFHSQCVKYGELIYCLPQRGRDIFIYDINKKEFRKIEISGSNGERLNIEKMCVVGVILYAISYGMGQVIEINLKEEMIVKRYSIAKDNIPISKAIMCNNTIYAVSIDNSYLIIYEVDKSVSQYVPIMDSKERLRGFNSIGYTNNQIWMCGNDNYLYSYDTNRKIVNERLKLPDDIKFYDFESNCLYREKREDDYYFQECVCFDDSIWFIPYQTNKIFYLKGHENIIREMILEDEEETVKSINRIVKRKYFVVKIEDEKNFIFKSFKNGCLYKINVCDETVEVIQTTVKYANLGEMTKQYNKDNRIVHEISAVDRNIFFYKLFNGSKTNIQDKDNCLIGKDIYCKLLG